MALWFTSDWHAGETADKVGYFPETHSFLRLQSTDILVKEWIQECNKKITPKDTLYFVGDMAITLNDLDIYKELPACTKVLVLGDKEYANKNFTKEEFMKRIHELDIFHIICQKTGVVIDEKLYFISHKPSDCVTHGGSHTPAICGHVHGVWRTQRMPNQQPIINVGIDAWHCLVSEEYITHQTNAILKNYYDDSCIVDQWEDIF